MEKYIEGKGGERKEEKREKGGKMERRGGETLEVEGIIRVKGQTYSIVEDVL